METAVIDSSKFQPLARGPRSSLYTTIIDQLIAMPAGKVLTITPEKGCDLTAARARIQTSIRAGLVKRGIDLKFSSHVSKDGTIGLRKPVSEQKVKTKAAPKAKAKRKAGKKKAKR